MVYFESRFICLTCKTRAQEIEKSNRPTIAQRTFVFKTTTQNFSTMHTHTCNIDGNLSQCALLFSFHFRICFVRMQHFVIPVHTITPIIILFNTVILPELKCFTNANNILLYQCANKKAC